MGSIFGQSKSPGERDNRSLAAVNKNSPRGLKQSDFWNAISHLAGEFGSLGRIRRTVLAAETQLDSSLADYDDVLVSLLGDVATNYVLIRQYQEQIHSAKENVRMQREVLKIVQARFDAGSVSELDVAEAQSILSQTEAQIPQLEIQLRQAENRLCVLSGMPPASLASRLGWAQIPSTPVEVVVGLPAELLKRRPDIRRANYEAVAQARRLGTTQDELCPRTSLTGTLGYSVRHLAHWFTDSALNDSVGQSAQWNISDYVRAASNVHFQQAKFQGSLLVYRRTALNAIEEAENGIVIYLRAQERKVTHRKRDRCL